MSNLVNFAVRYGANLIKRHTIQSLRCTVPIKASNPPACAVPIRANSTRPAFDVNTNVPKDVVLFKYENPRFYRMLNFFGVCQFVFWTYLSHFAFTTLKDAPVEEKPGEELKWYQRINLGENKYKNGITACSFLIGKLMVYWNFHNYIHNILNLLQAMVFCLPYGCLHCDLCVF